MWHPSIILCVHVFGHLPMAVEVLDAGGGGLSLSVAGRVVSSPVLANH